MTIKDIAREAGYAVGTVSRVINNNPNVSEAARARILEVIRKYNFHPNSNAKHLKQQASQGIAMIVKGTHNMLFASVLEKMQTECTAAGYNGMVYYIDENDNEVDRARQICREHKPHGVIFLGSDRNHFTPELTGLGVPCLLMTNTAATAAIPNLSSVSVDDVAAAARMVGHLLDNGHRRIAFIGGDLTSSQPSSARLSGCLSEFSRRGLSFEPDKQYIAARYTLPGGFEEGKNYKTYTSPAECEAQLRQLLADPAAILAMAQHNAAYYQAWLRPEQQVRQALRQLETGEM